MKEPWQIFADEYKIELSRGKSHVEALVEAMNAVAEVTAITKGGVRTLTPPAGLAIATMVWHKEGTGDWALLRSRLRDAWTDEVMPPPVLSATSEKRETRDGEAT